MCRTLLCNNTNQQHHRWILAPLVFLIFYFVAQLGSGVAETRGHTAHVHGIAQLNVALEGNELMLELISPAANIVGFEHKPKNEEQIQVVEEANELLQHGEKLFVMTSGAQCSLHEAHVEGDILHDHEDAHAKHDHDHDHDHGHGDAHAKHDHGHGDDHADHDHGGEGVHSDIRATYHFECGAPKRLQALDVQLFEHFPGLEKLEVQLLTADKQTAADLTAQNRQISF